MRRRISGIATPASAAASRLMIIAAPERDREPCVAVDRERDAADDERQRTPFDIATSTSLRKSGNAFE